MLSPETFVARWRDEVVANEPEIIRDDLRLTTCPANAPGLQSLCADSARFLLEAGLPCSCAPFLSFREVGQGLPNLATAWRLHDVSGIDADFLSRYHMLGSDGAGNPLCIDSDEPEKIFMVDHDDAFRTRSLVASSVPQFAEALLAIHVHPHTEFRNRFRVIDPAAATPESWLIAEAAMLID